MRIQWLMMIVALLCCGPIVSMDNNKNEKTLNEDNNKDEKTLNKQGSKVLAQLIGIREKKDFLSKTFDKDLRYYMRFIQSIAQAIIKHQSKFYVNYIDINSDIPITTDVTDLYKIIVEHLLETAKLTNDNNEEVQKIFRELPLESKVFIQNIFSQQYPNLLNCVQEITLSNKKCLFAVSKYKYLAIAYANFIEVFMKEENGQYTKKTSFDCGAPILGARMVVITAEEGDNKKNSVEEDFAKEAGNVFCIVLVDEKKGFLWGDSAQQILAFDCDKGNKAWGLELKDPITDDQFDADGFCVAVARGTENKESIDFHSTLDGEYRVASWEGYYNEKGKHYFKRIDALLEVPINGTRNKDIKVNESIKKIRLLARDYKKRVRKVVAVMTEGGLRLYSPTTFFRFKFDGDKYKNKDFSVVDNSLLFLDEKPTMLHLESIKDNEQVKVDQPVEEKSYILRGFEGGMVKDYQKEVVTKELSPSWPSMKGKIEKVSSNKAGEILIERRKQGWFFAQKSFAFWNKNNDTKDLSVNWDAVTLVDNGGVFCFKDNKLFFLNSLYSLPAMMQIAQAQKSGTLSTLIKSIDEDIKEKASPPSSWIKPIRKSIDEKREEKASPQSSWSSWIKPIKRYVIPTAIAATTAFGLYRGMQYWNKSKQLKGIEN